jgi:hypothetical protein
VTGELLTTRVHPQREGSAFLSVLAFSGPVVLAYLFTYWPSLLLQTSVAGTVNQLEAGFVLSGLSLPWEVTPSPALQDLE